MGALHGQSWRGVGRSHNRGKAARGPVSFHLGGSVPAARPQPGFVAPCRCSAPTCLLPPLPCAQSALREQEAQRASRLAHRMQEVEAQLSAALEAKGSAEGGAVEGVWHQRGDAGSSQWREQHAGLQGPCPGGCFQRSPPLSQLTPSNSPTRVARPTALQDQLKSLDARLEAERRAHAAAKAAAASREGEVRGSGPQQCGTSPQGFGGMPA